MVRYKAETVIKIQLENNMIEGSQICGAFQAEANREGGAYNVGPGFLSFVSLATSSAHVDCVRFLKGAGMAGGSGDGMEELTCL